MGLMDLLRSFRAAPVENRSAGETYTAQLITSRAAYIGGVTGIGELTATVQSCISLWEGALSLAAAEGAPLLDPHSMAIAARGLALRGEAVFLVRDKLIPATGWDVATRDGVPRAYRLSLPDAGGGRSETVLAAEVLHFRIASDAGQPWTGQAPLRRSSLTAGLLQMIEAALAEIYQNAPMGSQVIPFPESDEADLQSLGREFRGRRGRVIMRESVNVTASGGPAPAQDWRPDDVTPDIQGMMPAALLSATRAAICNAFGVLPAMMVAEAQGPMVREAQRHLAQWTLQPIAMLMAEECAAKLGGPVMIDVMRPLQAFDSGNRARSAGAIISALAEAKTAGLDPAQVDLALSLVNWGREDGAA